MNDVIRADMGLYMAWTNMVEFILLNAQVASEIGVDFREIVLCMDAQFEDLL